MCVYVDPMHSYRLRLKLENFEAERARALTLLG